MLASKKEHNNISPIGTSKRAAIMLNDHLLASMATGLIPIPLVDFAALIGVQFKMIHSLRKLYGREFPEYRGKALITSLVGGALPVTLRENWLATAKRLVLAQSSTQSDIILSEGTRGRTGEM